MKRSTSALLAAAALVLAACGDDATGPGDSNLTQAEAEALVSILMSQSYDATTSTQAPAQAGPQAVPIDFEAPFEAVAQCPLGGSLSLTGTFHLTGDSEIEGGTLDYSITQTHQGCVARDEESGLTFTLDGDPSMTTQLHLETSGSGSFSLSGSIVGGIAWTNEEKSGSCTMSLSFTGSGDATGGGASSVSGTICGVTVSEQVSVS